MKELFRVLAKCIGAGSSNTLYVHIDRNIIKQLKIKKGDFVELAIIKVHKKRG